MTELPRSERKAQNRVIALFTNESRPDWLDRRAGHGEGIKWGEKWGEKWGDKWGDKVMREAGCIQRVSPAEGGHWEVIS